MLGGPPSNDANIIAVPSAKIERCNPGSFKKLRPTTSDRTIWCPICSFIVTIAIGTIASAATFHSGVYVTNGTVNLGKLNHGASITGWKLTKPAITATIYPNIIPNNTGICFAKPFNATQQKIVAASVISATVKYVKSYTLASPTFCS